MFEEKGRPGTSDIHAPTQRSIASVHSGASATVRIGKNGADNDRRSASRGKSRIYLDFPEERSFREYLLVINRYRLLIVICILLGFGLAHYQNKKAVRLYSSTSLVNISSYVPVSEGIVSRSLREESSKEYYLEMLLALLKSFKIAERVLASNEDVRKFLGVKGAFVSSVPSPLEKNADSTNPVDPKYAAALKSYLRRIDTQHVKDSGLVKIIATTNKPKMSALMANLHAEQFIQLVLEDRKLKAEVTLNFLQGRLSEAEAALNDVRERKLAYARQNPAIAANVESIHRSFQAKYDRLMSGMTQVAAETSAKSNYLRLLNRRSMEDVAAGAGEMSSIMNVEKLRSEYEAWRKVIKNDQSPYLAEYRRQIKIAETALARHARIKRESAESAYRLSRDREEMLKKEFDRLAAEEKEHSSVRVEYDALLLEEAVAKEAVDKLSDRLNDAVLNSQNEQKTVVLIDPAVPDPVPVSPNTKANLIKGTLLGLFLGMVLAFLLDVSDTSIRTIQDLERVTDMHVLGVIPRFERQRADVSGEQSDEDGMSAVESTADAPSEDTDDPDAARKKRKQNNLVVVKRPQSREGEAIRSILVSMTSNHSAEDPRIILVTSGEKGEGKTTFAVNLAAALAELGEQTLIIDGDFRLPNVDEYFALPDESMGIVDYLAGKVTLFDAVYESGVPHLSVMPAGTIPESPTYFLRSARMAETLAELSRSFDYIIVDSPPIGAVSDSLVTTRYVHGVVMVVRCKTTPRHLIVSAIDRLQRAGAPILGIVLNDAVKSSGKETYGYYSESYYRKSSTSDSALITVAAKMVRKAKTGAIDLRREASTGQQESKQSGGTKRFRISRRLVEGAILVLLFAVMFGGGFLFSHVRTSKVDADVELIAGPEESDASTLSENVPVSSLDNKAEVTAPPPPSAAPGVVALEAAVVAAETAASSPAPVKARESMIPPRENPDTAKEAPAGQESEMNTQEPPAASPKSGTNETASVVSAGAAGEKVETDTGAKVQGLLSESKAVSRTAVVAEQVSKVPPGWYIQLSELSSRKEAQKQKADLQRYRFPCQLETVRYGAAVAYRVLVGPFSSREGAAQMIVRLKGVTSAGSAYGIRDIR